MPERIQLRRTKGWRKPEGAIVVSRPSRWGNPFRIYHGHSLIGPRWGQARGTWGHINANACIYGYVTTSGHMDIQAAVDQFRLLMNVRARDESDRLREWLAPLRGHDLACWCPLDQPCHGDVLLEIANFSTESEVTA
ncbi:hypothetical protein BKG82_02245 [Mycobacteroides chelonae]|uniref:DUF4326 domain-containing protein n=1 Tax=Mycobacteroides chelonae TaxID=1774 RepID=A0A1S1LVK8_MYCCH|nr:DUF4326 domain-containing protein [Mycobacteroides chelonae]OHU60713.1 hypothetical protein BKG82_02245 [Mycobacteroides chelonae]